MAESHTKSQYHTEHKLKNDFKWYVFYTHPLSLSSPFLHIRSIQYYSKINLNFPSGSRFGNESLLFLPSNLVLVLGHQLHGMLSVRLFYCLFFVCLNSTQRIPYSYWIICGASSAPSASCRTKFNLFKGRETFSVTAFIHFTTTSCLTLFVSIAFSPHDSIQ